MTTATDTARLRQRARDALAAEGRNVPVGTVEELAEAVLELTKPPAVTADVREEFRTEVLEALDLTLGHRVVIMLTAGAGSIVDGYVADAAWLAGAPWLVVRTPLADGVRESFHRIPVAAIADLTTYAPGRPVTNHPAL